MFSTHTFIIENRIAFFVFPIKHWNFREKYNQMKIWADCWTTTRETDWNSIATTEKWKVLSDVLSLQSIQVPSTFIKSIRKFCFNQQTFENSLNAVVFKSETSMFYFLKLCKFYLTNLHILYGPRIWNIIGEPADFSCGLIKIPFIWCMTLIVLVIYNMTYFRNHF